MARQHNSPLPPGTKLQQYMIDHVISTGGFSIVYLARNEYGIPVAIKEFMPANMPLRKSKTNVVFQEKEEESRFFSGLRNFFKEAEAISKIDDLSVVRILNFFMANNTAYLVMPFEHGRTLQRVIVHEKKTLTDQALQRIFCDLLRAVHIFHQNDLLHLDLKPSNIWVRADGSTLVLDFGTSRSGAETSRHHQAPMHTPGFAAPEQHRKYYKPGALGPWTDIYNLAATIYACIEGGPPQNAEDRRIQDKMPRMEDKWRGLYSDKMLRLLDRMLRLSPTKRPKDAYALLQALKRYSALPNHDCFEQFAYDRLLS